MVSPWPNAICPPRSLACRVAVLARPRRRAATPVFQPAPGAPTAPAATRIGAWASRSRRARPPAASMSDTQVCRYAQDVEPARRLDEPVGAGEPAPASGAPDGGGGYGGAKSVPSLPPARHAPPPPTEARRPRKPAGRRTGPPESHPTPGPTVIAHLKPATPRSGPEPLNKNTAKHSTRGG